MAENLSPEPKQARFSHVLRNKNFLCLWFAQLVSQLADRFLLYTLMLFAYFLTHTNVGVSLPMLTYGVPAVLFGSVAGVFVDRWSKKRIMISSNLLRGVLILLIIPFLDSFLGVVFFISFLIFTVTQFFIPSETSSIPSLVGKQDLIAANSLFMLSLTGASIVGIGLAAPLTNYLGVKAVLLIAAALYLAATVANVLIVMVHKGKREAISLKVLGKDFLMGLEFIRRKKPIYLSLFKLFFSTSVLAVVCLLAVSFSEDILKIGAANFGYLIFSAGAGMVVGGLSLERVSHWLRKERMVLFGFLLGGIALLLLSRASNIWLVFTLLFFLGLGNAFIFAPLQTILHEKVPRVIRGRVFGVQNMFINSAFTFPAVIMGAVADVIGLRAVVVILGIAVLSMGILGHFAWGYRET